MIDVRQINSCGGEQSMVWFNYEIKVTMLVNPKDGQVV